MLARSTARTSFLFRKARRSQRRTSFSITKAARIYRLCVRATGNCICHGRRRITPSGRRNQVRKMVSSPTVNMPYSISRMTFVKDETSRSNTRKFWHGCRSKQKQSALNRGTCTSRGLTNVPSIWKLRKKSKFVLINTGDMGSRWDFQGLRAARIQRHQVAEARHFRFRYYQG